MRTDIKRDTQKEVCRCGFLMGESQFIAFMIVLFKVLGFGVSIFEVLLN